MITKEKFSKVLECLHFIKKGVVYSKHYKKANCDIKVDFENEKIVYPNNLDTGSNTTTNFSQEENFVVFECVNRLLEKGYMPNTIFLEKVWTLGHTGKSGRADITVYDNNNRPYLIIECKRAGKDFKDARKELFDDPAGKQLFSYWAQARSTKWLQLYASDYDSVNNTINYKEEIVRSFDDKNVELLAKEDESVLLYKNASTAEDFFIVWDETYSKKTYHNIIFGEDALAYNIGNQPIKNKDLKKFNKEDGITNIFREILRHNNISDKENAFNKLLSLFICKFVDEAQQYNGNDIMKFQYIDGTDDYYSLYERLLGLFQIGMNEYLKENVFYLENDYIRKTLDQYTGKQRCELEKELVDKFQKTKMLSCQVFAFREVYNEKLFLQNGKVLVEIVELFQNYRLAYTSKEQFLGELFENLLDQGFKQEAGQYFTPIPITRFVWNSLPIDRYLNTNNPQIPKVIDFACGSGHFLTEGISAISDSLAKIEDIEISKTFYGIEKDNRLARVSKVAMLLNGAANANIKAGDGLEPDEMFLGELNSFDILVANPPYSVDAFKTHESRKVQNTYETIKLMSFDCRDIQNVFIERMHHLLKPKGIAAIVLPSTIMNSNDNHGIKAREILLKNFYIRCVSSFGGKTFSKTPTSTVILFLEHFDFPPQKAQMLEDSVDAILHNEKLDEWKDANVFNEYLKKINVSEKEYQVFISERETLFENDFIQYFKEYEFEFNKQTSTINTLKKIVIAETKERIGNKLKKNEKSSNELRRDLNKEFYEWVKRIEHDKLLYFALTYQQQTLIITAPFDSSEQKKFLGYETTERRGKEGLKETDGLLTNISNRNDNQKLAWSVRSSFSKEHCINGKLDKYARFVQTSDMLNFQKPTFSMEIKLAFDKGIEISSKFPLKRLDEILVKIVGNQTKIPKEDIQLAGPVPVITQEVGTLIAGYTDNKKTITDLPLIVFGDHNCTLKYVDFEFVRGADGTQLIKVTNDFILKYVYEYLSTIEIENGGKYERHFKYLKDTKIPQPTIDIQKQIVTECEKVDTEYKNGIISIEENKKNILKVLGSVKGKVKKLKDIAPYATERIAYSKIKADNYITTDNLLQNCEGMEPYVEVPNIDSVTYYKKGDILVSNIRPYLKKIWLADREGGCSPDVLVFRPVIGVDSRYVYYAMRQDKFFDYMMSGVKGMKMPRGNKDTIPDYEIVIPNNQVKLVAKIEAYEQKIAEARAVLSGCVERKKLILEKWLK